MNTICTKRNWTNYSDVEIKIELTKKPGSHQLYPLYPLYSLDSLEILHLDIIPGVLKLSSKRAKTTTTRGYIMKEFEPAFGYLPTFMVKTSKIRDFIDKFVLVKIIHNSTNSTNSINHNGILGLPRLSGTIEKYIGNVGDIDTEKALCKIISTCTWSRKFDKMKLMAMPDIDAEKIGFTMKDLTPKRLDLSESKSMYIVSVDPVGSKDIDDAISLEILSDRTVRVGIHIADPSSYLIENSLLDIEFSKRCESIYLSNQTIHMIPEELSIDVFSLKEKHKMRTFSVFIDLKRADDGKTYVVDKCNITKTIITINENTTYDAFQESVNLKNHPIKNELYEIGRVFYKDMLDKNNIFVYDAKKMIEVYMIFANSIVANKMVELVELSELSEHKKYSYPIIIRAQKALDSYIRTQFTDKNINKNFYKNNQLIDEYLKLKLNPAELRFYSKSSESEIDRNHHNALGLKLYTHFTSPIRRYSDILVHRILYNLMTDGDTFNLKCVWNNENKENPVHKLHTIFLMNHQKEFYRKIYRLEHEIMIVHQIIETFGKNGKNFPSDRVIKLNGIVLDIIKEDTKIRKIIVKCTNSELLDKTELANTFKNSIHTLKITDMMDKERLEYVSGIELFQKIEYKACFLALDVRKIRTYI